MKNGNHKNLYQENLKLFQILKKKINSEININKIL